MTPETTLWWVHQLTAVALCLQSLEDLQIWRNPDCRRVWSWEVLGGEYSSGQRWFLGLSLSDRNFPWLLRIKALAAVGTLAGPNPILIGLLFSTTLLVGLRWRGNFNGGSDQMTLVLLGALLLASGGPQLHYPAVLYLAVQATLSYFVAGLVKARQGAWWSGQALTRYLTAEIYPVPGRVQRLARSPGLMRVASWSVLIFELAFPLCLLAPQACAVFLVIGLGFHLANAWAFGLNRFFWTWAATYPALYYCSS